MPVAGDALQLAPTTLYRFFNNGDLLYVGVTANFGYRVKDHCRRPWWPQVTRIELVNYELRAEAIAAETKAIRTESPKHNTAQTFNNESLPGPYDKYTAKKRWLQGDLPDHPGMYKSLGQWEGFHCNLDKELRRCYGLTCKNYWELLFLQDGKCAICGRSPSARRWQINYDRANGEVLGILCIPCDRTLSLTVSSYFLNPPGKELGLKVPPHRTKNHENRKARKRITQATLRRPEGES